MPPRSGEPPGYDAETEKRVPAQLISLPRPALQHVDRKTAGPSPGRRERTSGLACAAAWRGRAATPPQLVHLDRSGLCHEGRGNRRSTLPVSTKSNAGLVFGADAVCGTPALLPRQLRDAIDQFVKAYNQTAAPFEGGRWWSTRPRLNDITLTTAGPSFGGIYFFKSAVQLVTTVSGWLASWALVPLIRKRLPSAEAAKGVPAMPKVLA